MYNLFRADWRRMCKSRWLLVTSFGYIAALACVYLILVCVFHPSVLPVLQGQGAVIDAAQWEELAGRTMLDFVYHILYPLRT